MADKTGQCHVRGSQLWRCGYGGRIFRLPLQDVPALGWLGIFGGIGGNRKPDDHGPRNINVFASSDFAERANCKICGSAIWWRLTAGPYVGKTSIPVGLLDDTDGLIMSHEYFVDYKNSTSELPDSRVQRTGAEVEKIIADFMAEGSI